MIFFVPQQCTSFILNNVSTGDSLQTSVDVDINESYIKTDTVLRILHINICSLINKIGQVELITESEKIDILCISESWCLDVSIRSIVINNFVIASFYNRQNHIHGGVIIFVRKGIHFKNLQICSRYSEEMQIESCGISFDTGCDKLCVINVYRPPKGNVENFINRMSLILNECNDSQNIILCGDMNIDNINSIKCRQKDKDKQMFLDLLQSYKLTFKNRSPTRECKGNCDTVSKTQIDYFATNIDESLYIEEVMQLNISDHYGLLFSMNISSQKLKSNQLMKTIEKRQLGDSNIARLHQILHLENFQSVYEIGLNVNEASSNFLEILNYVMDVACPKREIKLKQNSKLPWMKKELQVESENLRNMHWLIKQVDNEHLRLVYNERLKQHKQNIDKHKKGFYQNKIINKNTVQEKKQEMWNVVREFKGEMSKNNKSTRIQVDGTIIEDQAIIASSFAHYYTQTVADKIKNSFQNKLTGTVGSYIANSFYFHNVNSQEILEIIKNMRNKNSIGFDGLPIKIIKEIAYYISEPISYIVNTSFEQEAYPDMFKIGKIIPVFKKGDNEMIDNYRPITIPSAIAKIIETAIYNQVKSFLNRFNIISDHQNGFCPGKSTETATISFMENIYRAIDKGKYVASLFFDMSKAFDSIDLDILSIKLHAIGIRGKTLTWLMSYMRCRKVYVQWEKENSELYDVNMGVPQGSILGPLIFLLFINDLPSHLGTDTLVLYADDTSISQEGDSVEELQFKLDEVIQKFMTWCYRNKLILNAEKTVLVQFFGRKRIETPLNVIINNFPLQPTDSTKFLGIYIDFELNWKVHIDNVIKNLSKTFYAILQLKKVLDTKSLLDVYFASVHSVLSYNIPLWGGSTDSNRVFIAQKRIIRLIFGMKQTETCKVIFKNNKILTLSSLYIYRCVVHIKKNEAKYETVSENHRYQTRHGSLLKLDKYTKAMFQKSPTYASKKLFNHLPQDLKSLPKIEAFKKQVKNFLIDKCFYSVEEFFLQ